MQKYVPKIKKENTEKEFPITLITILTDILRRRYLDKDIGGAVYIDISNFVVPLSASATFHNQKHGMADIIMIYRY